MEPSKTPSKKLPRFNPKLSLDISDRRQTQVHHYKYINTLESSKMSQLIKQSQNHRLGSYNRVLKKIKQMRYFNNENLIFIPQDIFSILKKHSRTLKRADCIEFRNIHTIRHFKALEQAILADILPSEVKGNKKLTRVMFSIPLFATRTNFESIKHFFSHKTVTPNYSNIKEVTVEMDNKIYRFKLSNAKEFAKLTSEFKEFSLHLHSNIPAKQVEFPPDFLVGEKKAIQVLAPTSDFSLPLLDRLAIEVGSSQKLESLVFFEEFETKTPNNNLEEKQESISMTLDFKFLKQFENLRVLGLGFDCSPFAKNVAQVINSLVFPESVEFLGLQLINCDLGITVEEFLLSSGARYSDSALVDCFKPFVENFSRLSKLKTFALEVNHPSTDAKFPFYLSYEILKRIPNMLNNLHLGFDHCCRSLETLEVDPIMKEIHRLRPDKLYISLPLDSATGICDKVILRDIVSMQRGYLLTNFSKETLAQIAQINGNNWFFGTTFGNACLSFPYEDFLKSDLNIQEMLDMFVKKDVLCTVMPHSLMYFLNLAIMENLDPKEPDVRLAKVSYKKNPNSEKGETHVLLEGEIQISKQKERINMIVSLGQTGFLDN